MSLIDRRAMKNCLISALAFLGSFLMWWIWAGSWGVHVWRLWVYGFVWAVCILAGVIYAVRAIRSRQGSYSVANVLLLMHSLSSLVLVFFLILLITTGGHPRP